jgi:hypothetical protein
MGIVLAVTFLAGIPSFTEALTGAQDLAFFSSFGGWLSLAAFAALAWALIGIPLRARSR